MDVLKCMLMVNLMVVMVGCTVGTNIVGRWIDPLKLQHIQKGRTSEDLVLYHLGSPEDIKRTGDSRIFTYRYCEFGGDGITERAPGRTKDLSTVCDFLYIEIDYLSNIVIDVEYKPRVPPKEDEEE